ncbi:hypothetical protein N864_20605 [Intrasporangium chromatireducens Q5-1]|uniref:Uncharacterized protein n=1 Tax=Intrasporangium chromatireducens Q5-1 TaxID=584657 RepID=W9GNA0_9MICO|nr:hypothetical protein [Intrasporangium chromatireducens]EWT06537.1 hypothetical protein N864_20605 [Intrasporangium chromatireducens Q5-1]
MVEAWLRIQVDLTAGDGRTLVPSPGRLMVVPPSATLDQFGLAVDIAFGRWDTMRDRTFTRQTSGRPTQRRRDRHLSPDLVLAETLSVGERFTYVFDSDRCWTHDCRVEALLDPEDTVGLSPIPVPLVGWGTVPDQDGRVSREVPLPATQLPPADRFAVRAAAAKSVDALLEEIADKDLSLVLQQVGTVLMRAYRANKPLRKRLTSPLERLRTSLQQRNWTGDEILASEIGALLTRTERRGRTLAVDFEELVDVMRNAGDEPGGYLHLDTGEAIHAFLRHGSRYWGDPAEEGEDQAEDDDLWLYIDHDSDSEWQDMADFTALAGEHETILSVAIRGRGAFRRFKDTVHDLGLADQWYAFSDERAWGRARSVLHDQGIRAV